MPNANTIFLTFGPPNILSPRFDTGMVCPQHPLEVVAYRCTARAPLRHFGSVQEMPVVFFQ